MNRDDIAREELARVRHADKIHFTQKKFVKQYGAAIGIGDDTILSKYERGERRISRRLLKLLAQQFDSAIFRDLADEERVIVREDVRTIDVVKLDDGQYRVSTRGTMKLDELPGYLIAVSRGDIAAQQVRDAIPQLFSLYTAKHSETLEANLPTRLRPGFRVIRREGLKTIDIPIGDLRRLLPDEVAKRFPLTESIPETDFAVFEHEMPPDLSDVDMIFEDQVFRRSTLKNWQWISMHFQQRTRHQITLRSLPAEVNAIRPIAFMMPCDTHVVTASPTTVTVTFTAERECSPGHGWIVSWNPPTAT